MEQRVFTRVDLFDARESLFLAREEGKPPIVRFQVLPYGEFSHPLYKELNWTNEVFDEAIQNFSSRRTGVDPMLNFDHSTHNIFAPHSPAAGWPIRLEKEPNVGLFAIVELNEDGEEAISKKRYRYISAEFAKEFTTSTGEKLTNLLTGMALTNVPFHNTMTGLFSATCLSDKKGISLWVPNSPLNGETNMRLPALFTKIGKNLSEDDKKLLGEYVKKHDPDAAEALFSATEEKETVPEVEDKVSLKVVMGEPSTTIAASPAVTVQAKAEPDPNSIQLTREQYEDLVINAQKGAEANQLLMEQTASGRVEKFASKGFIPNNPEALEAANELALENPRAFEILLTAIEKAGGKVPLAKSRVLSPHTNIASGGGNEELGSEETFVDVVNQLHQLNPNLSRQAVMEKVQLERPDLYKKHRLDNMRTN